MYKYVKGTTIVSETKMLDSFEIAEIYNLWQSLDGSLVPNGTLVDFLIASYMEQHNYKTSDYYYINSSHLAFRVYQNEIIVRVMEEFIEYLKDNNIELDSNKELCIGNIPFIYYKKPEHHAEIISFDTFKKFKERKGDK